MGKHAGEEGSVKCHVYDTECCNEARCRQLSARNEIPTCAAGDVLDEIDYALGCLADNLAVAGALCESFWRGAANVRRWWPGCGKQAP